jgi:hypothetical protein
LVHSLPAKKKPTTTSFRPSDSVLTLNFFSLLSLSVSSWYLVLSSSQFPFPASFPISFPTFNKHKNNTRQNNGKESGKDGGKESGKERREREAGEGEGEIRQS